MKKSIPLESILAARPAIIGIGNELRGDDGAGISIVNNLQERGYSPALAVYDTPENYLQKIVSMEGESRLWIDVINWESEPGNYKIFLPEEIQHFAISTHNYSLTVLMEFLKPLRPVPDYFLGIQPLQLTLGEGISEVVREVINEIITISTEILISNDDKGDRKHQP